MVVWNLNDICEFKDTDKLVCQLKVQVEEFKTFRALLNDELSCEEFMRIMKKKEGIVEVLGKLQGRAALWLAENTADQKRNAHETRISELSADAGNSIMFFYLWFKELNDAQAEKYIRASGAYHYVLKQLRVFKPYTLSEKEEQVVALKDLTGVNAVVKLYDSITNKFSFEWEGKKITLEEINQFKQSSDRNKRKESYDLVLSRYGQEQEVLGELYKNIANDWKNENLKLRQFNSPISVRNLANDIPDSAVQVILGVVRKNIGLFHEYFRVKAKLLGLKRMDRYDLYAPCQLENIRNKKYSYEHCKRITLETYKQFSEQAYFLAKKIFDKVHVHSNISAGKQSGAFCYTVLNNITPYVLLNHVGTLNDLFTMMHEFGHGIHGLAAQHQTQFTFHSSLPMAETASIFGEMLLSKRLLKEGAPEEKKAILCKQLDGQYASIVRQAYFVLFETAAHEKIAQGATVDKLNALYLQNLREQFGGMNVPEVFQHEWKYIPHIYHTPFYCYAYVFGNLLVLSLYKQYEQEGRSFVPKYMKILAYGGSESPAQILREVGIDITKEAFWQNGFDVIRKEIAELKNSRF
ncbi:MAG: M3 family oligoendopeptidase [Candidatus Aenigmarchaeota archaeon]|nr:M3 family oligoendopeptidase [Candidatus Aenigmarchaeota archaeon]